MRFKGLLALTIAAVVVGGGLIVEASASTELVAKPKTEKGLEVLAQLAFDNDKGQAAVHATCYGTGDISLEYQLTSVSLVAQKERGNTEKKVIPGASSQLKSYDPLRRKETTARADVGWTSFSIGTHVWAEATCELKSKNGDEMSEKVNFRSDERRFGRTSVSDHHATYLSEYMAVGRCKVSVVVAHDVQKVPAGAYVEANSGATRACPRPDVRIEVVPDLYGNYDTGDSYKGRVIIFYSFGGSSSGSSSGGGGGGA